MDWPSFVFGVLVGAILMVVWWINSTLRATVDAWWRDFERTRLRIKADGERIERYVSEVEKDILRGARSTNHRFTLHRKPSNHD